MLVALIALTMLTTSAASAAPPPPLVSADVLSAWSDLDSTWFEVRRAAERRLKHLSAPDGRAVVEALAVSINPRHRAAAADWLRFRFERPGADPIGAAERGLLVRMLESEKDAGVVERLVHSAARDEDSVRRVATSRTEGRVTDEVFHRILEARVVILLEDVMHEGRVPGFFDGQFATLMELDPSVPDRLIEAALDPRLTFVVRALSVMALNESGREDLEPRFLLLFVPPSLEYSFPDDFWRLGRISAQEVQMFVRCRLSQYARFSLAKIGIAGPIEEKIAALRAAAVTKLARAEAYRSNAETYQFLLDESMNAFFELGYHHQQLDHYEEAEKQYRLITEREEDVRVKRWARYNLACIRAIQGRTEDAITEFERAVDVGFTDASWAGRDGDLQPLHGDPRFHRALRRAELGTAGPDDLGETP